jgi:hypothetical protein
MTQWLDIPNQQILDQTVAALKENGITAIVVENGAEAKAKVFELLPEKAEVMNMTSITLETIGVVKELHESGKYDVVKDKLMKMNRETQGSEMQKLGAAPDWAIGSVHAVTQTGQVIVASNTGSQLPAYAYGAAHVIWVVGAQKIVASLDEGMKRIYEHTLPLESERARKAYGSAGSFVSKLLIINKEVHPNRLQMIIVKEVLGF